MFLILPAVAADVPALSQLARVSFCETFAHLYPAGDLEAFLEASYAQDVLRGEVSNPRHDWLIVRDGSEAVAYLQCTPVGLPHPDADPARQGEIKRLYIRQSHQGRGLGKALMAAALGRLSARYGAADQWIGVWSENHKAQALYRAYGFERVGEYKFPVGGSLDDEFILRRVSTS